MTDLIVLNYMFRNSEIIHLKYNCVWAHASVAILR